MNTFSKGGLLAVQKIISKSLSGSPPFVITTVPQVKTRVVLTIQIVETAGVSTYLL
jgi:hypothetical protein